MHTALSDAWLDKVLGPERREMNSEAYQKWIVFSEEVAKNPKMLKTKKLCEGIENFYYIEDFITGLEERMKDMACKLFPCSKTSVEEINKHLYLSKK